MFNNVRTSGQLGPLLKQLRLENGWSQIQLGRKIGLSQERISVIEAHPERVTVNQLLTVLMALGAELQIVARGHPTTPSSSTPTDTKRKLQESW